MSYFNNVCPIFDDAYVYVRSLSMYDDDLCRVLMHVSALLSQQPAMSSLIPIAVYFINKLFTLSVHISCLLFPISAEAEDWSPK